MTKFWKRIDTSDCHTPKIKFYNTSSRFIAFSLLAWSLASCGNKESTTTAKLSNAESFAVVSCGLKIIDDGGDSSSGDSASGQKWSSPALESEGSWSIDTPIDEIISLRDLLNTSAVSASAAAQEDSSFSTLSNSTNSMASFVSQVVASLQTEPTNRNNPLFSETYFNTDLKTRTSACAALSLRLNTRP